MAAILNAAPPREADRLSGMQPELDYLCQSLPSDEKVLGLASIQGTGMGISLGVIALTPQRLVSVLGQRGKRGETVGAPAVTVTELRHIQSLTFGSKHVRGVPGYFATFVVDGKGQFIMDIGRDDDWADGFLNQVQRQANNARMG